MVSARTLTQWFLGLSGSTRHPRLDISLTPTLPPVSPNSSLRLRLVIEKPNVPANGLLLFLPTLIGNVPTNDYDEGDLIITDAKGPLPFVTRHSESPPEKLWLPERDTEGDITVSFTAYPRDVNMSTPVGPRVDLRENFGGLVGSGSSFIPLPRTTIKYNIHLTWNLSLVPDGTRAVWSFGEGNHIYKRAPAHILARSIYAVGPIQSEADDTFGMYWFGTPPFNVTSLANSVKVLFHHMALFFDDKRLNYRIFIRHTPRGYGGTAFAQSFILEYDDDTLQRISKAAMFDLLAHEMVHNWLLIDTTPGVDDAIDGLTAWYSEGM